MKKAIKKWLLKNTNSLNGKKVVITGATGGLGEHLCLYLAYLNAELILINRNAQKAQALKEKILNQYKSTKITLITADLEDIESVENACGQIEKTGIDILIHNAGAYAIERKICTSGFLNVFQINFVSPYLITNRLLNTLNKVSGRVVVVGSIAHNYSKTKKEDTDFKTVSKASLCYGNSKRYLMFAHEQLFKTQTKATLSLTHPGITFTGITDHYPKWLFFIIKNPMKVIFMKSDIAALNILKGVFEPTNTNEWFSPKFFGIWGTPVKRKINTADICERRYILEESAKILKLIENKDAKV